jgi:glutaconate CoA-transferase, subunit A
MQQATASPQRRSVVSDLDAAAAQWVQDGMIVALGGFHTASRAMAFARAIVRAGRRNLTLIGAPAALDAYLLIAAGCVKRVMLPYVGVEGVTGVAPFFRRAAEKGEIEIREVDEGMVLTALKASRQGLSHLPWKGGVGTSIPELNPDLRVIEDVFTGLPLIAVPAVKPDVAIIHAAQADAWGNVQHLGNPLADALTASASEACLVQVERIVPGSTIRRKPERTTIPAHLVSAVTLCPYGAHPFDSQRHYVMDRDHVRTYLTAARAKLEEGDRGPWDDYLQRFVFGPKNHAAYLEAVGMERLLALRERPEAEMRR